MIDGFVTTELTAGRILGPIDTAVAESILVNQFGLVPKDHNTGKR